MADDILKACSKCKQRLPHSGFAADRRASDGLQSQCRECANAARRAKLKANPEEGRKKRNAYYQAHKGAVQASNAKSRIKRADKIKEHKRQAYLRDRESPAFIQRLRAYAAANKGPKREYDREYRAKNAAKLEALKTAWRADNAELMRAVQTAYKAKRRAIEKSGDSSRKVATWLGSVPKLCLWCGTDCADDFHIDHFQPLALGGEHRVTNLAIACPSCNVRKNALPPDEFCRRMGLDFAAIQERHRMLA